MSRSRLVLAVLVLAAASAASVPAHAAKPRPKTYCKLVVDDVGKAGVLSSVAGSATYDPSLDIVSADVASNATTLTAVIRVKDLTPTSTMSPGGRTWGMTFTNGTVSVGVNAYLSDNFGERFSTKQGGAFDIARDEVRIHVALADIAYAKIKKGSLLRGFYATTNSVIAFDPAMGLGYGFPPFGGSTDDATAPKSAYPAGARSCVKVGK